MNLKSRAGSQPSRLIPIDLSQKMAAFFTFINSAVYVFPSLVKFIILKLSRQTEVTILLLLILLYVNYYTVVSLTQIGLFSSYCIALNFFPKSGISTAKIHGVISEFLPLRIEFPSKLRSIEL